jgi:omega-6 fatty acid desaturase (delta-12 desaturase)
MNILHKAVPFEKKITSNSNFVKVLAKYRTPDLVRSVLELGVTTVFFAVLWGAAWWALSISYWLTLAISLPAGAFLIRLFLIKHDCGHGAFFRRRALNDWVGRILGVLTLTPYDVWRRSHALHHATSGNLDKRGYGDIDTLTIREYRALPRLPRLKYRLYRHPLVMFGIGPSYQFFLRYRLPPGFVPGDGRYWLSTMGTNASMVLVAGAMMYFMGAGPFLLVQLPVTIIAASMGVWLFYIQHQFDDTYWAKDESWTLSDASLQGSSHYELPGCLAWLTAHIGIHHVHHLSSRIPFYRLPQVLRDNPSLSSMRKLTLIESLKCARLRLWDEGQSKMVTFSEARSRHCPGEAG